MAPRKTTAHRKTKGPKDISQAYGAPFPIYTEQEGERFNNIKGKTFSVYKTLDDFALETIGMKDEVYALIARIGLKRFVEREFPTYIYLTMEFFTTFTLHNAYDKSFTCRLNGCEYVVDYDVMSRVFGLGKHGLTDEPTEFSHTLFWEELTSFKEFNNHVAYNGLIQDHALLIFHKYLCSAVFGKKETNKMSRRELFYLWCLKKNKPVNTIFFLFQSFHTTITHRHNCMSLGHIITGLAYHFNVLDADTEATEVQVGGKLTLDALQKAEIIDSCHQLIDPKTRKCYIVAMERLKAKGGRNKEAGPSGAAETQEEGAAQEEGPSPGWHMVLAKLEEQGQVLQAMDSRMAAMEREQRKQAFKMRQFYAMFGYEIESPPPSPSGS